MGARSRVPSKLLRAHERMQGSLASQRMVCQTSSRISAGTLPDSWRQLAALQELHAANNSLRGTLPARWDTGVPSLRVLSLGFNSLTGALPSFPPSLVAPQSSLSTVSPLHSDKHTAFHLRYHLYRKHLICLCSTHDICWWHSMWCHTCKQAVAQSP